MTQPRLDFHDFIAKAQIRFQGPLLPFSFGARLTYYISDLLRPWLCPMIGMHRSMVHELCQPWAPCYYTLYWRRKSYLGLRFRQERRPILLIYHAVWIP